MIDPDKYLLIESPKNAEHFMTILSKYNNYHLIDDDKENIEHQLYEQIIQNPYPTLQIFHQILPHTVMLKALNQLTESDISDNENAFKLYNLLANFNDNLFPKQILNILLHKICPSSHKKPPLTRNIYLSLLGRMDFILLKNYLKYAEDKEIFPYKNFFFKTIYQHKEHCLMTAIQQNVTSINSINDSNFQNILKILKIIKNMENQSINDLYNNINLCSLSDPQQLNGPINLIYIDLCCRMKKIIEILKNLNYVNCNEIKSSILMDSYGILNFFYNHKSSKLMMSFDNLKKLTEINYEYKLKLLNSKQIIHKNLELEIFAYFFVIKNIYDTIIENNHKSSVSADSYSWGDDSVKMIIRYIKDISVLCDLLDDIFKLIFMRYDQLQITNDSKYKETNIEKDSNILPKTGFICDSKILKKILMFLKVFIVKRLHSEEYKSCNEELKLKFSKYSELINDAVWKLLFFEKYSISRKNNSKVHLDDIYPVIKLHANITEKTSSDDDSKKNPNYSSLRRKVKTRKKSSLVNTLSQTNLLHKKDLNTTKLDRNIINKMLGKPESLAVYALGMENVQDVKYIIQMHNLQNTELEKELNYLENMQIQRKRLHAINERYKQQEEQTANIKSVIERIKKVAAIGFEISKIINIIEKFTETHQIEPTNEHKFIIEKYAKYENYQYLQQYCGNGMQQSQIIHIFDLIFNSNFNYEICGNIMNIIKKLCGNNILEHNSFNSIGCIPFFKHIIECMRILKNHQIYMNFQEMLCKNCHSLRPQQLLIEIDKHKSFMILYEKSDTIIQNFADLKALAGYFDDFKSPTNYYVRFYNYMKNLSKLLCLRGGDNNSIEDLNFMQMIQLEPKTIIGDLIFINNLLPQDIENYVYSLNFNLIYVIANNICPEICNTILSINSIENPYTKSKNLQNVYNYVSSQNLLLGYLLQKLNINNHNDIPKFITTNIQEELLHNFIKHKDIQIMSDIFNGNLYTACLLYDQINVEQLQHIENDEHKIELLYCLMETKDIQIEKIIFQLIHKNSEYIYLIHCMKNITIQAEKVIENIYKIKDPILAETLIQNILLDSRITNVNPIMLKNLEILLQNVKIYAKIWNYLNVENWIDIYKLSHNNPSMILNELLTLQKFELIWKWSEILPVSILLANQEIFFQLILNTLIDLHDQSYEFLLKVIEKYPLHKVIDFYDINKEKFHNILLFSYIINYLIMHNTQQNSKQYKNYEISIKIFEFMSSDEHKENWNLLNFPLLLIEQFIMNSKFEIFTKIIHTIKPMLDAKVICNFCNCHNAVNIYDIYTTKTSNHIQLLGKNNNHSNTTDFVLLNFNLYQKDHLLTIECIDLLLRIYATKALDYQINENYSSSSISTQSNDMTSLDSLYESFVMPKNPPNKCDWIRDEDATHCMCCRRAVFTMLIRRHHCRRCGRVVCFACSSSRILIPELYENVKVRVCSDCFKKTEDLDNKNQTHCNRNESQMVNRSVNECKWQLSGNLTHDKLLREEFCYEHAPSVALCLSILSFHTNNSLCINLLLYHCRKLEKLLVPNPEVDCALVAKMMNCLGLAAKVRGGPPECDIIQTHSDIIKSIVQNGLESMLPPEPLNNVSLRKLGDSLILAEEWSLALEVFLKSGFSITGVMAAHGLSCIRAGCFEKAREKLAHCLSPLCKKEDALVLLKFITIGNESEEMDNHNDNVAPVPVIKRQNRSPPLLIEIIKTIESTSNVLHQQETLRRASIIRNSNTSLTSSRRSQRSTKHNIPINEPALNILQTLSNLKNITNGNYGTFLCNDNKKFHVRQSRYFEECLYYMLLYGSHSDIINFLIRHKQTISALRYYNLQKVNDSEIFIQCIFMKFLKTGSVNVLINCMLEIDERLLIWKELILNICRYLENKQIFNSLHQLQILLKDPVRASMTCVKFYSMNVSTFNELQNNSFHLINANEHLQSELELCQWENIQIKEHKHTKPIEKTFLMQMDGRTLNHHINTISRQLEVTKFLALAESKLEKNHKKLTPIQILNKIRQSDTITSIPTLFDTITEKIQICILVLVCGKNIDEGFGLAFRIIQDFKLPEIKVYGATAKYLTNNNRLNEVEKLIGCIISNNCDNPMTSSTNTSHNQQNINQFQDEILAIAINSAVNIQNPGIKTTLDQLIKRINNIELQISCHIYIGQLKSAYLLAVKHNRLNDIKKILRQAEITNQVHIKKICEKKLKLNN